MFSTYTNISLTLFSFVVDYFEEWINT